nr:RecName: Full=Unknown protein from spot 128 of 2D-PAGE of etiolated coleoptile [Zea mays]
ADEGFSATVRNGAV